jgi:hypothetical protein
MDPKSIGIVLPLSGAKKEFGERALLGIGISLKGFKEGYRINLFDSQGSGALGAFRVKELILQKRCAVIVGGLFSDEATKEYLEAKKNGVFFISLSSVYLPKEEKDNLLLEIPGSIESQIHQLFSQEMLSRFGKRTAIFYQKGPMGDSYAEEFWRKAKESKVEVTGVQSFSDKDYLKSLKNLLGMRFEREREEEKVFFTSVYSSLKKSATKKIQTLQPQTDFDWVFIPAFPQVSLQIIPTFAYLDATSPKIIGGPSWRSAELSKESKRLGEIYFVGDRIGPSTEAFSRKFYYLYQKKAKLLEIEGFDALEVVRGILSREGMNSHRIMRDFLAQNKIIKGLTGKWLLQEGLWMKEMTSYSLNKEKIASLFNERGIN